MRERGTTVQCVSIDTEKEKFAKNILLLLLFFYTNEREKKNKQTMIESFFSSSVRACVFSQMFFLSKVHIDTNMLHIND